MRTFKLELKIAKFNKNKGKGAPISVLLFLGFSRYFTMLLHSIRAKMIGKRISKTPGRGSKIFYLKEFV